MSFVRSLLLLVVCVVIAAFVGVNWTAMNQPTDLSLIFTRVQAPLGLVLLGFMALLAIAFIVWMAYTQGRVLMETRRHAKELAAQRELADKAEVSRFTDLRMHMDDEVTRLTRVFEDQTRETMARIDRAEMGLRERPVDAEVTHLVQAVDNYNRDLHSRIDRMETGLRERPLDAEMGRLVQAVDSYNRDLHARVDRLEMGLREGLAGYIPAPASVRSPPAAVEHRPQPDDPGVHDSSSDEN